MMIHVSKWMRDYFLKFFKSQDGKEEKNHTGRDHDPEFIRRQLLKAAEIGTVEKRIQANRANIQRSALNMDKNFAKR